MYKVIVKFADLEDNGHIYNVGDEYPREGLDPTVERIAFLASNANKLNTPVIEIIPEPEEVQETPKKRSGKKNVKE